VQIYVKLSTTLGNHLFW